MIFDRTQKDVDEAISLREEKVKNFQSITESEAETLERGMLTINTLNRIEKKQAELKSTFSDMGYWNTPTTNKEWDYTGIFNVDDFQRIIDNENVLREAFFVYAETPKTPPVSFRWGDINALEKILYDLDVMINDVKRHYRECGNFECGEE